jgi:hypothetical protein
MMPNAIGAFAIVCFANGSIGAGIVALLIAAVFGVATYGGRRSKHWVNIRTAGAEQKAMFSYDSSWTTTVISALNNAITRG